MRSFFLDKIMALSIVVVGFLGLSLTILSLHDLNIAIYVFCGGLIVYMLGEITITRALSDPQRKPVKKEKKEVKIKEEKHPKIKKERLGF